MGSINNLKKISLQWHDGPNLVVSKFVCVPKDILFYLLNTEISEKGYYIPTCGDSYKVKAVKVWHT